MTIQSQFKTLNPSGDPSGDPSGKTAFIAYIMAGDPDLAMTAQLMDDMANQGVDIIELGMPFSDPMADGPAIQDAAIRALTNDPQAGKTPTNLHDILQLVRDFRAKGHQTPIVLMGYFNPIFAYGAEAFCRDAAQAGINGLLIVDIPPEESNELSPHAAAHGLDIIRLITPTTDEKRLKTILKDAGGFLYYVAITGVTGTASADPAKVAAHLDMVRAHTDMPIAVGFGIKTPQDAANMAKIADGIVVGSALVQTIFDQGRDAFATQLGAIKKALA